MVGPNVSNEMRVTFPSGAPLGVGLVEKDLEGCVEARKAHGRSVFRHLEFFELSVEALLRLKLGLLNGVPQTGLDFFEDVGRPRPSRSGHPGDHHDLSHEVERSGQVRRRRRYSRRGTVAASKGLVLREGQRKNSKKVGSHVRL